MRRLCWLILGSMALLVTACPKGGEPITICPSCKYKVSTGKLVGRMNADYSAHPYPMTNLVVDVKMTSGAGHPFAIQNPSSFASNQLFSITVTTTITSGVSQVNATWKAADGAFVTQTAIPLD